MEFALEKRMPAGGVSPRNACFTVRWQSSKLPSTAQAATLAPGMAVICRRWISLTPSRGYRTSAAVPGRSRKPFIAAEPVSPDVAVRISAVS